MLTKNNVSAKFSGVCWYSRGLYNTGSHFADLFQFLFGQPISWSFRKRLSRSFLSKDPQIDLNISFSGGDIEFKSVPNQHLFYNSFELFLQKFVVFYKQNGDLYLSQISKNTETNDRYNVANTAVKVSGDMDNYQKNIYCDIVKQLEAIHTG